MAHLACGTPPSQAMSAFKAFDLDIRSCVSRCAAVDTTDQSWQRAELGLSRGPVALVYALIPVTHRQHTLHH